jgi:DNA polymerase-3 subunit epsilon
MTHDSISLDENHLESLASVLDIAGDYRVLRRLQRRHSITPPASTPIHRGLVVDVETTGRNPRRDEIIELAMVPFTYTADGTVCSIGDSFHGLQQSSQPIPAAVTALTGITPEMVAGQALDSAAVARAVAPAELVIAHNAGFDRLLLERQFGAVFEQKPWACSLKQIAWSTEGMECTKLACLASAYGFFYDRHRAENDCLATIELLARPLPRSPGTGLQRLLDGAQAKTYRVWASGAKYETKDALKARDYTWGDEHNPVPKTWYLDVPAEQCDAELRFLRAEIYQSAVPLAIEEITAYTRFSDRIGGKVERRVVTR